MTGNEEQVMQLVKQWRRYQAEIYDLVYSMPASAQDRSPFEVLSDIESVANSLDSLSPEIATQVRSNLETQQDLVHRWFKMWWPSS